MTETFNIDPSDPWKGRPDFIKFTNRVLACGVDVSLCESSHPPLSSRWNLSMWG